MESVLGKLGIQLRTTYGEWRRVEDILDDVSDRWDTLNQTEQNAISTAIAGTRQRENFLALMSNYQRALELEETALTSNGIAAEKFDTYLQSIEASMNELKSAFESFAYSEGSVAVVNGVIKVLTLLMKTLKELTPVITFVLSMLVSAKIFNGFVDGVSKVGVAFAQLAAETGGVKSAIAGLSAESGIFASALKALISPAGLLAIALTAVGAAAVYQHRKQREAEKTIHNTAEAYKEQADEIDRLKEKQKDIAEQIATMESLDKSIVDPDDLQRLKDESAELEKQIKQKERLANIDAAEGYKDSREQLGKRTIYPDAKGMTFEGNYALIDQTELYISQYKSINEQLQENIKIRDSLINAEGKVAQEELAQYNSVNDKISRLREKQDKYLKTVQANISLIRDAMAVLEANGETTGELYDTYSSFLNVLNNFEAQVKAATGATDDLTRASQDNSDALEQQILDGQELANVLNDLASKQKLLATAQEDVTNTGAITASTLASIASQYPSMVDAVASYIAGLTSEKELLDSLQQAYIDNENAQLQLVVDKLQNDVEYYNKVKELNQDWINDMDKVYGLNLNGAKDLAEAKAQADQVLINALRKIWSDYFKDLDLENKSALAKIIAVATAPWGGLIGKGKKEIEAYGEIVSDLNKISLEPLRLQFDKLTSATNTSKSSTNEYAKELKEAQSIANKLLQYTINMLKKEAELRKQKLKEELEAYKDIIDARKEALDLEKEQYDYEKSISKQNSQISQLESQIAALQYDTSAEGVKKRLELEEKLAEARSDLEDEQFDHSIDKQKDALDKEYEDFEKAQNRKIKAIEKYLSETGKIAQEAIDLIDSRAEGLFDSLMHWNLVYGDGIRDTIVVAWGEAYAAMEKYKLSIAELKNLKIDTTTGKVSGGSSFTSNSSSNSSSSSSAGSSNSSGTTTSPGTKPNPNTGRGDLDVGSKVVLNGRVYGDSQGNAPGRAFTNYRGKITKVNWNGTRPFHIDSLGWVSAGDLMPTYHAGINAGFVGGAGGNEVFAKLMKGEAVVTPSQQDNFMNRILPESFRQFEEANTPSMQIGNLMEIVVQGNLDKNVIPELRKLKNEIYGGLNEVMFRRGYTRQTNQLSI